MIVWLASYPRSGNTLLRMILKSVFGKVTYSKYNDLTDIGADPKMMDLVGHRMFEGEWDAAHRTMTDSDDLVFVKTHDGPEDSAKAIYVVRDGRAACVSYSHYRNDFFGKEISMCDIIVGFDKYGSWGGHLDAWDPLQRPDTLLVYYENLLSNPMKECERIATFLGINIAGSWRNDFQAFQAVNPRFFRKGDLDFKKEEFSGDDLAIFWSFHGDWMETLGYTKTGDITYADCKLLRKISYELYVRLSDLLRQKDELLGQKNIYITDELGRLNTLLKQKDEQLRQKNEYMKTELGKLTDLLKQKDELVAQFREKARQNGENLLKLGEKAKVHEEQFRQKCEELIELDNGFKVKCAEVVSKDEALVKLCEEKSGELQRFEEELRRRDERIAELLNSISWKVTSPLRAVYEILTRHKK